MTRQRPRKSLRKAAPARPARRERFAPQPSRLEGRVLAILHGASTPLALKDLFYGLNLPRNGRKELLATLDALLGRGFLSHLDEAYALTGKAELLTGTIAVNPKGFGFVAWAEAPEGSGIDQDVFIPPGLLGGAAHGDRVLALITGRSQGRFEGQVIEVLNRATTRLIGIYRAGGANGLVIPEDSRFPYSLVIQRKDSRGAKNGEAVLAEVSSFVEGQRNLPGVILEVLGNPADIAVQTEMVIRKFELPHRFSPEVEEQVAAIDPRVRPAAGRGDLRGVCHVTIDGETARDFDDAVAIEPLGKGFRLYVSIADVSHYVRPGTPLDLEAYQRGTSVYFPNRVIPMLPERLSNDLCSLVPDQDRYAMSAILDFDAAGRRIASHFTKSLIRSRKRLTYTVVRQILEDQDPSVRNAHAAILNDLERMGRLALLLEKRRMARGSIGFELPEPLVELAEDGTVRTIRRSERNRAHRLIEEFMLAANEAVAEYLEEQKIDAPYRVHEDPDPLKVAEFTAFARGMGLPVKDGDGSPKWFGGVLALAAGTPREYIVSNLLLRTMKQARYTAVNLGHFGLAASHYTHFTSPIRRYPDLMVHRALSARLGPKKAGNTPISPAEDTEEAAGFLSKRERVAVEADREMVERLQVGFMANKIGEDFDAVISGVSSFGLYVELVDVFVSGAVAIGEMKDDYYELEASHHRLVGRRTGTSFQIGDLVRVRLLGVESERRRINFGILERAPSPVRVEPGPGRKARKK